MAVRTRDRMDWITTGVAVLGGLTGLASAYFNSNQQAHAQVLDEHGSIAQSYAAQIASAQTRRDSDEVKRLRIEYEKYEESWRAGRKLSALVGPIESLDATRLEETRVEKIDAAIAELIRLNSPFSVEPEVLAAAYIATKDFPKAIKELDVKADYTALALKSLAYEGMYLSSDSRETKEKFSELAVKSFLGAIAKSGRDSQKLIDLANQSSGLRVALLEQGYLVTQHSLQPLSPSGDDGAYIFPVSPDGGRNLQNSPEEPRGFHFEPNGSGAQDVAPKFGAIKTPIGKDPD